MTADPNPDRIGYGLRLSVYKTGYLGDCTNGGITSNVDQVTLVGVLDYRSTRVCGKPDVKQLDRYSRVFPPAENAPPVWLVVGRFHPQDPTDMYLHPGDVQTGRPNEHPGMAGGNFADTTDSRWHELTGHHHAVRVHDRYEGARR